MNFALINLIYTIGLLLGMLFLLEVGRRIGLRRMDEANDIGSAYLLVDLLRPQAQIPLRNKFRQYVDSRLETYRKMPDLAAAKAEFERSKTLQDDIWTQAVTATRDSGYPPVAMLIFPAISKMINISTQRTVALQTHPPTIIFVMLAALMLAGSLLAGYGMASGKSRNWMHTVAFVVILTLTAYVIRDLDSSSWTGRAE